ncbi:hypothetical protein HanXRQr2_Chr06g0255841 [Helianthus annuus]|uniref:Uncharacterized protein n=1 Tax=Helianthus annuus TaxID=4232 RepID=A0A9K3NJ17_HELAN|nr:hypothetical protein HanXRQr2_Chr06g0255841 [Helianthus annuus]
MVIVGELWLLETVADQQNRSCRLLVMVIRVRVPMVVAGGSSGRVGVCSGCGGWMVKTAVRF